jgi:hypothetical protein
MQCAFCDVKSEFSIVIQLNPMLKMVNECFQDFEFVAYTSERGNSYVSDGVLHIAPTLVSETRDEDFITHGKLDLPG